DYAQARISEQGDAARFAYGLTLFFEAVEGLSADLYRYGLTGRGVDIPFVRFPVPINPSPDPIDYARFRAVLQDFEDRLARSEKVLGEITDPDIQLPLRPVLARLDLDGNSFYETHERLAHVFFPITFGRFIEPDRESRLWQELDHSIKAGDPSTFENLDIIFVLYGLDSADAVWLQGYCHLLSAMVDILLAHDWEDSFNQSFHVFFPRSDLPYSALNEVFEKPDEFTGFVGTHDVAVAFDIASFAVHSPWKVVEPGKMRAARGHLKAMIATSRRSWDLILGETDTLRTEPRPRGATVEWISAPDQHQPAWRGRVTKPVVDGWLKFLDAFEAMLDGVLLIPHWRFDEGINVRRMFEDPRPLSPILLIQGADALPYLEDGPMADGAYMEEIMMLLDGDLLGYFIWFN
ncbi:MAG: hypothetical protein ACE5FS_13075, partial [Paracoccaceae bacterium]